MSSRIRIVPRFYLVSLGLGGRCFYSKPMDYALGNRNIRLPMLACSLWLFNENELADGWIITFDPSEMGIQGSVFPH